MSSDTEMLAYFANFNTMAGRAGRTIDPTKPGPDADRIAELEIAEGERFIADIELDGFSPAVGTATAMANLRAELACLREQPKEGDAVPTTLNEYAQECHQANIQWWRKPEDGSPIQRNKGELLMLIVSEVAECMEGERKGLADDKLPHRSMAEVELADILIRVFDYAGAHGYDIHGAYLEKMAFNASRVDHKHGARLRAGGKKW